MDHSRVDISSTTASCGIVSLSRMSDEPEENLFVIANHFYHPSRGQPPAFVLYSNIMDHDRATSSSRFTEVVAKLGMGVITRTPSALNPKTGNPIVAWIWTIDHEKLKTWYQSKRVEKLRS